MKRIIIIVPLMALTMSIICSCGDGREKRTTNETVEQDTTKMESDTKKVVAFLNHFYKELEEAPNRFQEHISSSLSEYMVKNAMEKLLVESDYEEEGDPYFYDTEFFIDGTVSGSQHGDYNYPVLREISIDEGHWYKIYTEFADNIPAPTLIKVKVEKFGEKYMITDVQMNE